MDAEALKNVSQQIAAGATPKFPDESIIRIASEIQNARSQPAPGAKGCLIMQWVAIGAAIGFGLAIGYLYLKIHH